jgi:hypothetical protein
VARSGVVGYALPPLRVASLRVHTGDYLFFATDGVAIGFVEACAVDTPPDELATRLLGTYGRRSDDALLLVIRCGDLQT